MSNKKQSSIEWLVSQLQKSKDWHRLLNEVSQMSTAKIDIIEQAKAMHKEEVVNAYQAGDGDAYNLDETRDFGEQYYTETFGGNNE